MKMQYELQNNEGILTEDLDVIITENSYFFNEPFMEDSKIEIKIQGPDYLQFIRSSTSGEMLLNLRENKVEKGEYNMNGFSFIIHTKCKKLEIKNEKIYFEYILYVNHQKENEIKIKLTKL